MSILLFALTALGIAANIIGALCIIAPCVAVLAFMVWVLTNPA